MDRLRVGVGILILIVALGSCATVNHPTTTFPKLSSLAEERISGTSESANQSVEAGEDERAEPNESASGTEPPEASLVAPERVPIAYELAATAGVHAPTLPPETSIDAPTPARVEGTDPTDTPLASLVPARAAAVGSSRAEPRDPPGDSSPSTFARPAPTAPTASNSDAGPSPNSPAVASMPESSTPTTAPTPVSTATNSAPTIAATAPVRPSAVNEPQRAFSGPLDELIVELPGEGWTYVGAEGGSDAVRLRRKRSRDDTTSFTFEMSHAGEYTLWFQRQDSRNGTYENEAVSVTAMEGSPHGRVVDRLSGSLQDATVPLEDSTREPSVVDYSVPLELVAGDDLAGGVRVLLELSKEHDPQLADLEEDEIGALVARAGNLPTDLQRELLERVAASESTEAPGARSALLDFSIARADPDATLAASNGLILAGEAQPQQLLDAANVVAGAGNSAEAIGLALTALGEDASPELLAHHLGDEALFIHARRLEELGPDRDLRKALAFYEAIVDGFPLSARWEESRARVSHLQRHYFDVR